MEKRQTKTIDASESIAESRPKPISDRLPL
jgi:hypothetical protein